MSKLYVIGVGPGSEDYLTSRAREIVDSIDVLAGCERSLSLFPEVRCEQILLKGVDMRSKLNLALSRLNEGKSVALLSTGDPGFSGILKTVLDLSDDVDLEVVPGVSSLQLCAAKLKMPWDNVNLITLHGKEISDDLVALVGNGKPTFIFPHFKVGEVINFLIDNGVDECRRATVCERLSYPDERIVHGFLNDLLQDEFGYMCIIVVY